MKNFELTLPIESKTPFKQYYMLVMAFFYAGQGYALGSLVLLLPLYIHTELGSGSYTSAVLLSTLIIIPWYVKFVFGIISDNYPIGEMLCISHESLSPIGNELLNPHDFDMDRF